MTGRALVAASVCGVALSFAFPEPGIGYLAWVAIAPLLVLIRGRSPRAGAVLGLMFGLGFFGALIIWIKFVGWIAWAILVLLEASFIAAFGASWAVVSRKWGSGAAVAIAAGGLWVTFEWLRSIVPAVGFTWGQLAQSQTDLPWVLRTSGLAGSWTVSLVIVAADALLAQAWLARRAGRKTAVPIVTIAVVVGIALGAGALWVRPRAGERSLTVAIVQGDVVRGSGGTNYDREIARIERHARLTRELADDEIDLVVWPESSVGVDPERDRLAGALLGDAARSAGVPMIVGANFDVDVDSYLVVALLVSPEGDIADIYQKTHLVPFGEYVPARSSLSWIPMLDQVPRDALAGDHPTNFTVDGVPIATVISFEGDFGPLVRDRIAMGGRVLIVATNTSTWEESWASAQHVAFSRVRAAENGVPVIHAALSGISAFVSPDGALGDTTDLYEQAVLVGEVTPAGGVTPYARTGDWLPVVAAIGSLVFVAGRRRVASSV